MEEFYLRDSSWMKMAINGTDNWILQGKDFPQVEKTYVATVTLNFYIHGLGYNLVNNPFFNWEHLKITNTLYANNSYYLARNPANDNSFPVNFEKNGSEESNIIDIGFESAPYEDMVILNPERKHINVVRSRPFVQEHMVINYGGERKKAHYLFVLNP